MSDGDPGGRALDHDQAGFSVCVIVVANSCMASRRAEFAFSRKHECMYNV